VSDLTVAVQSFSEKISSAWRQATDSILETGRLLTEAENKLSELDFLNLIEVLPFTQSTAIKLLTIGHSSHLENYKEHLPPHWTTIYELALMPEDQLRSEIETGHINPSTERSSVVALKRESVSKVPASNTTTSQTDTPTANGTISQTDLPTANAIFGKVEIPQSFDRSKLGGFQSELDNLLKKYGAEFTPDITKKGMFRVRREALTLEMSSWLTKREKSYNKPNLSDNDIKILEDAFGQVKGKLVYHENADGTFDRNDIRNPEHPYHGWGLGQLFAYCREHMIITSWTRIRELDKTAWVNQLIMTHSQGNAAQRLDAKRKLERLASRGGDESKPAAVEALETLIEPL
jgi:hypothetical protein